VNTIRKKGKSKGDVLIKDIDVKISLTKEYSELGCKDFIESKDSFNIILTNEKSDVVQSSDRLAAIVGLAFSEYQLGCYHEALENLMKVDENKLEHKPLSDSYYLMKAICLHRLGVIGPAKAYYNKVENCPDCTISSRALYHHGY
jgi:hypothetical protein